jgi:hypothetical protein
MPSFPLLTGQVPISARRIYPKPAANHVSAMIAKFGFSIRAAKATIAMLSMTASARRSDGSDNKIHGLLSKTSADFSIQPFVDRGDLKSWCVGGLSCQQSHAGKMMKRLSLTILCCFLLSGCVFDPAFDTSSWDAYQRSLAAIKAKLSNDDLNRLAIALGYLLIESTPPTNIDGQFLSDVAAQGNLANPYVILNRLGPKINGRDAATIIKNLSIKLDAEISESEARLQHVEAVLESVEVISPRYYWRRSGYLEQPVIEFAVRNAGKSAISRIYFSTVLTTPNRSIPWAKREFIQTFKGGLEPREKQQLSFQPHFGDWNDPQLEYLPDAELKVAVTNFEDANGETALAVDTYSLDMKRKVRAALQ